jgi:NAD(P)-dependent dehydrogenase (short-subunit alcohol dehydrogenase family)
MAGLITGGARGVGLAIAKRFAKPDVDIFIAYRNDETAAAASNEIAALGARPYATKADVSFLASPEMSMIQGPSSSVVAGTSSRHTRESRRAPLQSAVISRLRNSSRTSR